MQNACRGNSYCKHSPKALDSFLIAPLARWPQAACPARRVTATLGPGRAHLWGWGSGHSLLCAPGFSELEQKEYSKPAWHSTCNSSKGLGWSVAEGLWQTGNEPNGQLDQKRSPRQRQRSGAGLLGQRRSPAGDDNCKMAASGDPQLLGQGGAARARSLELVGVARPGGTR